MTEATSTLPAPMVPAEVDLRDFPFMPLDVVRLRDSTLAIKATGEEFRAAVLLWCASWHQIPAGSLPDDDAELATFAGFGRVVREFKKVKAGAIRGWVRCSDGRLYHTVIAEKAREAWNGKLRQLWRTECARIRKHNERHHTSHMSPDFDVWLSQGCPVGKPLSVTCDSPDVSQGQSCENESNRQGHGEGQGHGYRDSKEEDGGAGGNPPPDAPPSATPRPKSSSKDSHGTRLPADWKLPMEWGKWAQEEKPELTREDIIREAEKFRDHFHSMSGKDGRKADWEATWRNWIRKDWVKGSGNGGAGGIWFMSSTGITTKGEELGIKLKDGEPFYAFKERVFAKAGVTEEMVRKAKIDAGEKV